MDRYRLPDDVQDINIYSVCVLMEGMSQSANCEVERFEGDDARYYAIKHAEEIVQEAEAKDDILEVWVEEWWDEEGIEKDVIYARDF